MGGTKRSRAGILGEQRAHEAAVKLGEAVRASRRRRHLTQEALAKVVGISRQRLGDLEAGRGRAAPADTWFALAETLGLYLRFEFARDPQADVADAGHLLIQELVLRLTAPQGWQGGFELPTRPADPGRSVDVPLIDRLLRRLAIVECWNTFGDLGAAARSSNQKVAAGVAYATATGGHEGAYQVGLCWVVRDTKANRELVARYPHIFEARFPGSSVGWVNALTNGGPMPTQPGLIWCDTKGTRLFAQRQTRAR